MKWIGYTYLSCDVGFAVAIAGILIDDGISTSLAFLAVAVAACVSLSLFKQDDLKSSKLNSGNGVDVASATRLKVCNFFNEICSI